MVIIPHYKAVMNALRDMPPEDRQAYLVERSVMVFHFNTWVQAGGGMIFGHRLLLNCSVDEHTDSGVFMKSSQFVFDLNDLPALPLKHPPAVAQETSEGAGAETAVLNGTAATASSANGTAGTATEGMATASTPHDRAEGTPTSSSSHGARRGSEGSAPSLVPIVSLVGPPHPIEVENEAPPHVGYKVPTAVNADTDAIYILTSKVVPKVNVSQQPQPALGYLPFHQRYEYKCESATTPSPLTHRHNESSSVRQRGGSWMSSSWGHSGKALL